VASARSLWVWDLTEHDLDVELARSALSRLPGVRAALGPTATGLDGFRRSHLDALAAQRLLHGVTDGLPFATFDDLQLVALVAQDEECGHRFVTSTLGALATADPALWQAVRTYLRKDFSASRAAKVLFTHRNTVLTRLQRADALLPAPLSRRGRSRPRAGDPVLARRGPRAHRTRRSLRARRVGSTACVATDRVVTAWVRRPPPSSPRRRSRSSCVCGRPI
jgi:hypothetical protein